MNPIQYSWSILKSYPPDAGLQKLTGTYPKYKINDRALSISLFFLFGLTESKDHFNAYAGEVYLIPGRLDLADGHLAF